MTTEEIVEMLPQLSLLEIFREIKERLTQHERKNKEVESRSGPNMLHCAVQSEHWKMILPTKDQGKKSMAPKTGLRRPRNMPETSMRRK